MKPSAAEINEEFYDAFWRSCPDFSRYNPGVLHRRRLIQRLLGSIPNAELRELLDVGCGSGEMLMWLRSVLPRDVAFAGADISEETVEKDRARHPFARFFALDIEREALPERFGVVVCTEVVEHLDDRPRALTHLAEMLAPGGRLVLTCPTGKIHATEKHFGHVAHPRPDELRAELTAAGLEVVSLEAWGFPLYAALKYATNLRPAWALDNFAKTAYGSGAKLVSRALYYATYLNLRSTSLGCQLLVLARKR